MEAPVLISLSLLFISIIILIIHLHTGEKNHFLISMSIIVVASLMFLVFNFSQITLLFFLAATLSLVGDLLMARKLKITSSRTIDGGIVFGIAHIIYLVAFTQLRGSSMHILLIISAIVLALLVYFKILHNPNLSLPVQIVNVIYAILIMTFLASVVAFITIGGVTTGIRIVAMLGVVLFVLSDSVLAYNEFKKKLDWASKFISVTYILAQVLLQLTPMLVVLTY